MWGRVWCDDVPCAVVCHGLRCVFCGGMLGVMTSLVWWYNLGRCVPCLLFCKILTCITTFTIARQLSLLWGTSIRYKPPHPTCRRFILILPSHIRLGLPTGLFPPEYSTQNLYAPLLSPIRATCPAHLILIDFITLMIFGNEYI